MATYLQTMTGSFTGFAQGTNNYIQDVRVVGHLWCLGRDNIAAPLAKLANSAWVHAQPTLINLAGWFHANAAPVIANGAKKGVEYCSMINKHVQDTRYVGHLWCQGRDIVAIPMAAHANTALAIAAGWLAANAAPVTLGIVLLWAASRALK